MNLLKRRWWRVSPAERRGRVAVGGGAAAAAHGPGPRRGDPDGPGPVPVHQPDPDEHAEPQDLPGALREWRLATQRDGRTQTGSRPLEKSCCFTAFPPHSRRRRRSTPEGTDPEVLWKRDRPFLTIEKSKKKMVLASSSEEDYNRNVQYYHNDTWGGGADLQTAAARHHHGVILQRRTLIFTCQPLHAIQFKHVRTCLF